MVNTRVRNYDDESEEPTNVEGSFVAEATMEGVVERDEVSSVTPQLLPITESKEIGYFLEKKLGNFNGEKPELWKGFVDLFEKVCMSPEIGIRLQKNHLLNY